MSPGTDVGPALEAAARALAVDASDAAPAGGSAFRLGRGADGAFVKFAPSANADPLRAEADGLAALAGALRVPRVLGRGEAGGMAWLALEWLDLRSPDTATAAAFGRALASGHRRSARAFGWEHDNWIGASPQRNGWVEDWARFFAERRLRPQLERAGPALSGPGERLLERIPALLAGHRPPPALVHGDLWAGNWGALGDGSPVTFDPAVHYADRECDLAMTELFGGFPPAFYDAYREAWPLPPGSRARRDLYQLYHVLNHYNLFGGGYGQHALSLIRGLLERARG